MLPSSIQTAVVDILAFSFDCIRSRFSLIISQSHHHSSWWWNCSIPPPNVFPFSFFFFQSFYLFFIRMREHTSPIGPWWYVDWNPLHISQQPMNQNLLCPYTKRKKRNKRREPTRLCGRMVDDLVDPSLCPWLQRVRPSSHCRAERREVVETDSHS